MQINQELRGFIVENFLFGQSGNLKDDDSFLDQGIIDSTGILELVSFIEQKYGVEVEDQELIPENLDSVNALVRFLERKLSRPMRPVEA